MPSGCEGAPILASSSNLDRQRRMSQDSPSRSDLFRLLLENRAGIQVLFEMLAFARADGDEEQYQHLLNAMRDRHERAVESYREDFDLAAEAPSSISLSSSPLPTGRPQRNRPRGPERQPPRPSSLSERGPHVMPADSEDPDDEPVLVSLAVRLTPTQIGWLSDQASRQNTSVDHVVRRLVRRARADAAGGDSLPGDASVSDAPPPPDDDSTALERLRQAQERVQALTEGEHSDENTSSEDEPDSDAPPSMFDMVDRDPAD